MPRRRPRKKGWYVEFITHSASARARIERIARWENRSPPQVLWTLVLLGMGVYEEMARRMPMIENSPTPFPSIGALVAETELVRSCMGEVAEQTLRRDDGTVLADPRDPDAGMERRLEPDSTFTAPVEEPKPGAFG